MGKVLKTGIMKINTEHPTYSSLEKMLSILAKNAEGLDMIVGPEWSMMNNNSADEGPLDRFEFADLLDYIRDISSHSKALIVPGTAVVSTASKNMYNVLPVFYRGRVIFSTIKRADGGTSNFNDSGEYELVGKSYSINNTFTWEGIRIGVEICADSGRLYKKEKDNLDIQMLVSSGIRDTDLAVKTNGYLICSDGSTSTGIRNYVIRKNGTGEVSPYKYINFFKPIKNNIGISHPSFEFVNATVRHRDIGIYTIELP